MGNGDGTINAGNRPNNVISLRDYFDDRPTGVYDVSKKTSTEPDSPSSFEIANRSITPMQNHWQTNPAAGESAYPASLMEKALVDRPDKFDAWYDRIISNIVRHCAERAGRTDELENDYDALEFAWQHDDLDPVTDEISIDITKAIPSISNLIALSSNTPSDKPAHIRTTRRETAVDAIALGGFLLEDLTPRQLRKKEVKALAQTIREASRRFLKGSDPNIQLYVANALHRSLGALFGKERKEAALEVIDALAHAIDHKDTDESRKAINSIHHFLINSHLDKNLPHSPQHYLIDHESGTTGQEIIEAARTKLWDISENGETSTIRDLAMVTHGHLFERYPNRRIDFDNGGYELTDEDMLLIEEIDGRYCPINADDTSFDVSTDTYLDAGKTQTADNVPEMGQLIPLFSHITLPI